MHLGILKLVEEQLISPRWRAEMANINSKVFVRGTRSIHLSNEGPDIAEKVTATVLLDECVMTTPPETLLQGQGHHAAAGMGRRKDRILPNRRASD